MEEKNRRENKKISFEKAIEELDGFFIKSNEQELYRFVLTAVEKPLFESVLNRTEGNQLQAAKILGINRNTLRTKIKKLEIVVTRWRKQ